MYIRLVKLVRELRSVQLFMMKHCAELNRGIV